MTPCCRSVAVAMEAHSAAEVAVSGIDERRSSEIDASAAVAVAGDEEASSGNNSLTSCEDDVLTMTDNADETTVMLVNLQPLPSSSSHLPSSALGNSRHTLPSTLQLCKVLTHTRTHTARAITNAQWRRQQVIPLCTGLTVQFAASEDARAGVKIVRVSRSP